MKICGIIAEYNPFHKGHFHQLNTAKEISGADIIAVVMSGMFVQRGVPAICSKFTRAKAAIMCGADIVIELPVCYTLQPAEYFALGGISILDGICAQYVSYGTEAISTANRDTIDEYINIQTRNSPKYNERIKYHIEQGVPHFTAKINAYSDITGNKDTDVLTMPNAILEAAYRTAIHGISSDITPLPVHRLGDAYHACNPQSNITSATAIRRLINKGEDYSQYVPSEVYDLLQSADIAYDTNSKIYDYFLHSVFTNKRLNNLSSIPDGSDEIANRILSAVSQSSSYEEFIEHVTTRRLTRARINRAMLNMILSVDAELTSDIRQYLPAYARVLALSSNGQKALGEITKKASIPIITSPAKYNAPTKLHQQLLNIDIAASNIYSYACSHTCKYNQDYTKKLFIGD